MAWEVVRQFHGERVEVIGGVVHTDYLGSDGTPVVAGQQAEETAEYKAWERKKYNRMKLGLGLLTVGFVLQLVANWIPKVGA